MFLIAVPTPLEGSHKTPDVSFIESAVAKIAPVLVPGNSSYSSQLRPLALRKKLQSGYRS